MKNKIIAIAILSMFVLTSISSIGVIAENKYIKTINKNEISEEEINGFSVINKYVNINPLTKKIIKQTIGSKDNGNPIYSLPGFYEFKPCHTIDISGKGTVTEQDSDLTIYLHEGNANLNDSYSDIFIEWEICAIIFITNFEGDWEGFNEYPFKTLSVTGSGEYAALIEFSYLLEIDIKQDKYERENLIPAKVQRMNFLFKTFRTVEIVNPHFYVYYMNSEENRTDLMCEETIHETWEITVFNSKTWMWNQKNSAKEQVQDGMYGIAGEFEVDGRIHPVLGDGVEIVEKIPRNLNYPRMQFIQILYKLSNSFSLIRNLLRLL